MVLVDDDVCDKVEFSNFFSLKKYRVKYKQYLVLVIILYERYEMFHKFKMNDIWCKILYLLHIFTTTLP